MVGFLALCAVILACTGEGEGKWRGLSGDSNPNAPAQCSEPRKYIEKNAYDNDSEFWSSLASNLTKQYGIGWSANAQPCRQYGDEESFLAVVSMVRDKEDPSPTHLQENVSAFCEAHSDDSRVDEAFNCSTGCPLADLLNQICLQARPPLCIEPVLEKPCENQYHLENLTCGEDTRVTLNDEYGYFFVPCGYPRCPGACDLTLTVDGVGDADLDRVGVFIVNLVFCPDTITVYSGSARNNDNILLNATCVKVNNYGGINLKVKARTFTIALNKSPQGNGSGFKAMPTLF